jgi:hypothetical protein
MAEKWVAEMTCKQRMLRASPWLTFFFDGGSSHRDYGREWIQREMLIP